MLVLASMVFCVTFFVAPFLILFLLNSRGKRADWLVAVLPGGLLVKEDALRTVPFDAIQRIEARGSLITVHTLEGAVSIDSACYGLGLDELERYRERAKRGPSQ
jgi:hypothetical protein